MASHAIPRLSRRNPSPIFSLFGSADSEYIPPAPVVSSTAVNPSSVSIPTSNLTISHSKAIIDSNFTSTPYNTIIPDYTQGLSGVNLALDQQLVSYLWVSIVVALSSVLIFRLCQLINCHIRHVHCLDKDRTQQKYWAFDKSKWWPWLKRQVIYAPLGAKRHNREIQLSSAVNYGTIPGRIHMALLMAYILSNIAYCALLPYGKYQRARILAELRGRSGMLATVNMIPLVILAARNNPVIGLLKISFDTFNMFHRWIGRLVIVESLVHVVAWYVNVRAEKGNGAATSMLKDGPFFQLGALAMIAMLIILFQSLSAVRHAFYETFLWFHQILTIAAIIGVSVHLDTARLPALPFIKAVAALWITERCVRMLNILWININFRKRNLTFVTVEALENEACRVTFNLPKHITIRPGSHVYAYLPHISFWQSHPFSVAWTDVSSEPPTGLDIIEAGDEAPSSSSFLEKQVADPTVPPSQIPTSVTLIVAARTGMTRKLYNKAKASENRIFSTPGFVEGPYAGHDSLSSYGTVVMFAGGAGITHHLIQIRHLIACASAGTVATRKIVLVWTIRDQDALTWIRPYMDEILAMPGRRGMLSIELYVTRPRHSGDYMSPSSTITIYPCRCDPGAVLDRMWLERVGATMVTVCGPGAFADEVRAAVRERIEHGSIEMNEESFTW